ncbi:hypothetical protein [Brevibacterium sp. UCMA 11754]|uniref:hypothetical protein n=1 Tax=Brevibacterium sp. UCMA 11754 TaxID=2749198 RepID=UPI001F465164|nr:hypothetical protein [Brevibacterium sp. UCMA 11754]MCF2574585.1 hypothetical protein [Brevibacterium sp. UCMA 11754]
MKVEERLFVAGFSLLRSSMPLFTPNMIIALLSSCASSLAAIALTAVSAWLIVEASYQPPIMILMVAIVGVRFFGLSRSVLLYLSRSNCTRRSSHPWADCDLVFGSTSKQSAWGIGSC